MTDLDALLAAIIATPDDDAARLVYADKYQDLDTEEARARAEFIRVQVELANSRKTRVDRGFLIVDDVSEDALRERERELLQITATDGELPFRLVWAGFDSYTTATGIDWIFSRGFIAKVRGPLAVLVGGECGRNGCYSFQPTLNCLNCHGTGRTPGVLPAIAQAHPLEWVEVTPACNHGRLLIEAGEYIPQADGRQIPRELFRAFDTEHAALAALSRALIAWARKEQTCTTA